MAKYKLKGDFVLRDDGMQITKVENNRPYEEFLAWVAEGNTPDPEDPIPLEVQNAPVLLEIQAAEAATLRAIREYILGDQSAVARLKTADDKIAVLRGKVKK